MASAAAARIPRTLHFRKWDGRGPGAVLIMGAAGLSKREVFFLEIRPGPVCVGVGARCPFRQQLGGVVELFHAVLAALRVLEILEEQLLKPRCAHLLQVGGL